MEQVSLSGRKRGEKGKNAARRIRAAGSVPAILYGAGIDGSAPLTLNTKELEKVLHTHAGGNVLVSLSLEGEAGATTAMFKEVLRHPVRGSIQHVDLVAIQMDHKVTIEVPLHIVGKAAGLAFGGIIQHETRTVTIECLPTQIPDSIDVDVTNLNIGQSLHMSDLMLPEGLSVVDEPETTIVLMSAPTAEAAPKTAEEVQAELAKSFEEKEEPKEE